jgi:hypothetical protein
MNDDTFRCFLLDEHDKECFMKFVRNYWREVLEDYSRAKNDAKEG